MNFHAMRYYVCNITERDIRALRFFETLERAEARRRRLDEAHSGCYVVYDEIEAQRLNIDMARIDRAMTAFDPRRLQRGVRNVVPMRWRDCAKDADQFIQRAQRFGGASRDEVIATLGVGDKFRYSAPWYAWLRLNPETV